MATQLDPNARTRPAREAVELLLVEDDARFADLLRAQLRRTGRAHSQLEVVQTVAAACAKLAEGPRFSLVITDLDLPDCSGPAAVGALAAATHVPLVVLTGDTNPATRAAALEQGAYDFVSKDKLSAAALERLLRLAAAQAGMLGLLRESEARFRDLIALSSDFYWESDAQHRVSKIEHGAQRHPAVNPVQIGKARWQLPSTHPDAAGWAAHRATLNAHQAFREFEIARLDEHGVERWRSISGEPIFDAAGTFKGYRGIGRDITARKRAEEELQRFRLAMDNSLDMIVLVDRSTMRFVDVNRTACTLLGYSREEMLAMGPQDILPVARAELEHHYDRLIADPALASGMQSEYRCKDGSLLPFESTRHVLRSGERWLIAAISRDIRERLRAEQRVARLQRMYAALGAANEAILRARSPQEIYERACTIAVEAGGFVIGSVYVLDAGGAAMHRVAVSGPAAGTDDGSLAAVVERDSAQGLIAHVWRSGEPAVSNDFLGDPRRRGGSHSYPVASAAVFPLRFEGALGGAFGLQHAERNAFTEELNGLLQRLADNVCFAVDNLRRESRRVEAERSLRASEERFRSLTQLTADVYWEQDEEARFTAFTDNPRRSAGMGPSKLIGKRRWEIDYVNMSAADWERHREVLASRAPYQDLELCRIEDGKVLWVSTSGEPVFDAAGAFRGYRGIARDISARKREEALRRLEHAVTRCLAEAQTEAAAMREILREVCETQGWECGRYFGVDEKAAVLRFAVGWGVADPKITAYLERSRDATYAKGQGLNGKVWESGEPLWGLDAGAHGFAQTVFGQRRDAFLFPVRAGAQTLGVLSFVSRQVRTPDERLLQAVRVIGSQAGQFLQRKRGEEAMRESEARFRSLTQLSSDWYWEQDENFRFTAISGRRSGGAQGQHPHIGKTRWETALEIVGDTWESHRAVLQARRPFHDVVFRRRRADGVLRYTSVSGEPVFDERGRFKGYRGVGRDITARKREEALLALEHAVTRRLASAESEVAAIREVIRDLCETEGWECGRYFRLDEKAGRLRFAAGWGIADADIERYLAASRDVSYAEGQGLTGKVWQTGEPQWVSERGAHAGVAQTVFGSTRDVFLFPLRSEGKTLGVLSFISRRLRTPDERLLHSVRIIGSQLGEFVQRKLAEEVLRERHAAHLRHQERIARFGQAALAKRDSAELVQSAVQEVLEGLDADAVAYVEPEPGAGVVLRALVGLPATATGGTFACDPTSPLRQALQSGMRQLARGSALPFGWARELGSAALVPVRGERATRGVLCVLYARAEAFGAEELNFAEASASVLSTGLQRIASEGRLAYLAQFDPLTGLPNRALLADRFSQMIVQAKRHAATLGVLFIDLDEFKMVNDTLGHAGGDELLKEVAVRLQACVRPGDTVARISGDEFAVVLGDLARGEDAAIVAQKIIDRVGAAVEIHGQEVFVTGSVGIALFPNDGDNAESLIGAADAAMYRAKEAGRNAFQFFTAEINQRSRARAQLGVELRRALEREEFALVYQPKIRLADGAVSGAEALLRWRHPERGVVSPAEFIPVLEETGLIVPVGEWVLRRACLDLKAWGEAGLAAGPVAVNLSARQFRLQDLDQRIKALVAEVGVDPALLELEITESQLMQDPNHAIRIMRSLRETGIRIAIDDFGTGYSSLAYLTRFPVASLKIDRSFVSDVQSGAPDATIVRTIIEMAHTLGFTVVAEGIEDAYQAEYLRRHGCEQGQGYFFARPMPNEAFRQHLAQAGRRAGATA